MQELKSKIAQYYNIEELQRLAFTLNADWDELAGEHKSTKVKELIVYLGNRKDLQSLIDQLREERPKVSWPDAPPADQQKSVIRKAFHLSRRSFDGKNMISNMQHTWIELVFEQALHETTRLELELTYDHTMLTRQIQYWEGGVHKQIISGESSLSDLFLQSGCSLLILGAPGSGKTFTMLELCSELLTEAELDDEAPVPIIIELSNWAEKKESLDVWLVNQFDRQYQLAQRVSQEWLDKSQIYLLLDGLDEVNAISRNDCVLAINEFKTKYSVPLAICSRKQDYEDLSTKLNLSAAVIIQPLQDEQVASYLNEPKLELQALYTAVRNDDTFRELSRTPLMLSIMALAYRGVTFDKLQPMLTDTENRQKHLFDAYIRRMFQRKQTGLDKDVIRYSLEKLNYLAKQMAERSEYQFYLEDLQPSWLLSGEKRRYRWLQAIVFGFLVGLVGGLLVGLGSLFGERPENALNSGLLFLLFVLLFTVPAMALGDLVIKPVEILTWKKSLDRRVILKWMTDSIAYGLGLGVGIALGGGMLGAIIAFAITGLFFWLGNGLATGLVIGLFIGLCTIIITLSMPFVDGLAYGLLLGLFGIVIGGLWEGIQLFLETASSQKRVYPNQGIRQSGVNALKVGLGFSLVFGLFIGLIVGLLFEMLYGSSFVYGLNPGLFVGLIAGPCVGFLMGVFFYGGKPFIAHYLLRWRLNRAGLLPFRVQTFLDTMAARILLQRAGAHYRFIHRTLQEHFASLTPADIDTLAQEIEAAKS